MLFRWIATADIPDLGLLKGDTVIYNPSLPTHWTVTRNISLDPGAVLNQSCVGALEEMPPLLMMGGVPCQAPCCARAQAPSDSPRLRLLPSRRSVR